MNQFKIEHDIPIPLTNPCSGISETLNNLRIGDSFVAPVVPGRTSAHIIAARLGIRVVTRRESEGLIRIWRIQ